MPEIRIKTCHKPDDVKSTCHLCSMDAVCIRIRTKCLCDILEEMGVHIEPGEYITTIIKTDQ